MIAPKNPRIRHSEAYELELTESVTVRLDPGSKTVTMTVEDDLHKGHHLLFSSFSPDLEKAQALMELLFLHVAECKNDSGKEKSILA